MAEQQQETEDKPYEPSQKKLQDARAKGNIARSSDLNTTAAYGGLVLVLAIWGEPILHRTGALMARFFSDRLWRAAEMPDQTTHALMAGPSLALLGAVLPLFLVPAVAVLLSLALQRAYVAHGGNIAPKASRISPLENFKKRFGRRGFFEFFKSFAKLLLYTGALVWFVADRRDEILHSLLIAPRQVVVLMLDVALRFCLVALAIAAVLGIVDYLFQRAEHLRTMRMSHKEMRDEQKEAEGDPVVKQRRRQRATDIARAHMLHDVRTADVVIVNPEHYAVALKWSRAKGSAPVCVAKGVDEMAATIRRLAAESAVPVYPEPPTARALYAAVEIGEEIPSELYRAVAAAIRFAEQMRDKMRKRPYGPAPGPG
ncbi:EscU/YscU/HrcU family type III secretion system export apparatus switch protein [Mangrovicoccus algicola]|uniref:Flagellar biosynthesis protein FlhB n=1 Tax=Mangrovicoccus algicola TaxID=2771008 RepID=A0A8J7CMB7_9RHOB|nr:flagellar type III secretion system protein FlhB [Mangrovicoccus algicola]MBE3640216.1 flagellar biosynthesis protein FlhB [Mangrovicoccus algicola]